MSARKKSRSNKTGRNEHSQFVQMYRHVLENEAFIHLSSEAKALYPHLKMQSHSGLNGHIHMSVRQAARLLNVSLNTATKAFHDLQAKGFIVMTSHGQLGVDGCRASPSYAVTEVPIPPELTPRASYRNWKPGNDFEVKRHQTNNPNGWNGKTHLKS